MRLQTGDAPLLLCRSSRPRLRALITGRCQVLYGGGPRSSAYVSWRAAEQQRTCDPLTLGSPKAHRNASSRDIVAFVHNPATKAWMNLRSLLLVLTTAGAISFNSTSALLAAPMVGATASVQPVQYRPWHRGLNRPHWRGHYAPGTAMVGGLAAGALIGSAISDARADANDLVRAALSIL